MQFLGTREPGSDSPAEINSLNPLPIYVPQDRRGPMVANVPAQADYLWRMAMEGRLFVASDADQNDMVTGATSFANTTPTWLLSVPAGQVALPLWLNLSQSGTVAGAAIDVLVEIDDVNRYASGGTVETVFSAGVKRASRANKCTLYSAPTAAAGYGVRLWGATLGQDVSPAEGAVQGPFWRPEMPYFLEGPASLLIYTYAGTTGPTWLWAVGWAEWTAEELFGP